MARRIELIYDRECPNVEAARDQLRAALAAVGAPTDWEEWDREDPGAPLHVKRYGSPTILVDGKDVSGIGSEAESNCCRVYHGAAGRFQGVPPLEAIAAALRSKASVTKSAAPE